MLDPSEPITERDIYANELFLSLQASDVKDQPMQFNTLLLYLVAALILDARDGLSKNQKIEFVRRDPGFLIGHIDALIRQFSVDDAMQGRLLAELDFDFIKGLLGHFGPLVPKISKIDGFAMHLFDFILERVLAYHGISLNHSRIVASLASSLLKKNGILETFRYSGEACIAVDAQRTGQETYYWDRYDAYDGFEDLIALRLHLLKLEEAPIRRLGVDDGRNNDLTLIDGAQKRMHSPMQTLSVLTDLLGCDELSNQALIVLNQSQLKDLPQALLANIADHDLLEAVIDFCSVDASGEPVTVTAWLLNRSKGQKGEALFIDATHLVDDGHLKAVWFAAAVLERWRMAPMKLASKKYQRPLGDKLYTLFLKHFDERFRDLPGLSITVDARDVLDDVTLSAASLLEHSVGKAQLFKLKNESLLSVLRKDAGPTCSYVIGDNGAGKSLLLKDLIPFFDQQRLNSVGIAFSAQDRFPLPPELNSLFDYQGTRSIAGDPGVLPSLSSSLIKIHQDPFQLMAFNQALQLLGFSHQLFLVPLPDPRNPVKDWERRLATVELHEDFIETAGNDTFEPGLQREKNGSITPFSELSSGEQQLLSLLTRICVNADHFTVFLIDEPEISLHVRWQQLLPSLLSTIAQEFKCSFVVATHAPIIVANARDEISHCFLARDGVLTAIPAHQRHSVESILLDGFNTYTPDNNEINERCAVLVSRAIRTVNQPGRTDPHEQERLLDTLTQLKTKLKASSSNTQDKGYKRDWRLINQATKAIKEMFERATGETSQ
ncbi:AAA family ATPase [Pseudomonas fontis]|uniref:ATP-binding protein n=1 Tax=Pseudomonas fontis TaxID=2942633 RepID=A0ABT5NQ82_9PSED|nr:AAA family ATPase [Pseudomonas fontis]MDD0974995.1 ATP-binding protein [Pseudomonas fontis]MDD0990335.1 ATP-binding protein [Pseudomonas fontis]